MLGCRRPQNVAPLWGDGWRLLGNRCGQGTTEYAILVGVLVFELLKVSMQFLGIDTSFQYIVQGLVIIVAVALDLRKYLAKK